MMSFPIFKKIRICRPIWLALLLTSLLFILTQASCFNSKTPERSYFSIDYTLGTQPRHQEPKFNATLVVQNVSSILAYDRQEIVYRNNPYEFQYYWYRLWASKPRKMLRELITGHLRYTQLFSEVVATIEDRLPDYALDVEIMAIEELDASKTEWYAHMALQFTLMRMIDNTVLWNYSFDARRPVATNQPVYVVKAMSELLNEELVKAFRDMDNTLSKKLNVELTPDPDSQPEPETEKEISQESPDDVSQNPASEPADQPRATLKKRNP